LPLLAAASATKTSYVSRFLARAIISLVLLPWVAYGGCGDVLANFDDYAYDSQNSKGTASLAPKTMFLP